MSEHLLHYKYYCVLDKGFVGLIDHMGDDNAIVQAARVSYGKGTKKVSDDRNLIRYLFRHRHTTPIEMCELKFHIKMPMDHWRQFIRHRTASVNEYSTRYSEALDDIAVTDPSAWRLQASNNKQGSDGFLLAKGEAWHDGTDWRKNTDGEDLSRREKQLHEYAKDVYNERLANGIAREQARKDLPLSNYTMAYWKIDLHNLFHFLKLRCDSHAQFEIRQYANILAGFVKELYPVAFKAWYDYSFAAVNFTRLDREYLNYIHNTYCANNTIAETLEVIKNREVDKHYAIQIIGMSTRELGEFWDKLLVPNIQDFTLPADRLLEVS